mgnify:CR=1 FL=1
MIHLEAGLRSGHRWSPFPEELNRRTVIALASLHLTSTPRATSNLLHEGIDNSDVAEDGNTITIQLINGYEGDVIGNAIVKFQGETTTKKAPRKDKKSRSPKTGATMATGLALAGAGAAVLAAMKKKQDAE